MYSRWAAEAVLQNCARRSSLEAERRVGSTQREAPEQRHNARKGGMIRITAPERMTTCCQPAKLMAAVAAAPRRGDGRRAPADRRREWAGRAPAAECRYFSAPPALHGRLGARCAGHGGGCSIGRAAQCRIAPTVAHTYSSWQANQQAASLTLFPRYLEILSISSLFLRLLLLVERSPNSRRSSAYHSYAQAYQQYGGYNAESDVPAVTIASLPVVETLAPAPVSRADGAGDQVRTRLARIYSSSTDDVSFRGCVPTSASCAVLQRPRRRSRALHHSRISLTTCSHDATQTRIATHTSQRRGSLTSVLPHTGAEAGGGSGFLLRLERAISGGTRAAARRRGAIFGRS